MPPTRVESVLPGPQQIKRMTISGTELSSLLNARDGELNVAAFANLIEEGQIVVLTDGDQVIAVTTTTKGAAALEVLAPRPLL
jgi:hypothetical protein